MLTHEAHSLPDQPTGEHASPDAQRPDSAAAAQGTHLPGDATPKGTTPEQLKLRLTDADAQAQSANERPADEVALGSETDDSAGPSLDADQSSVATADSFTRALPGSSIFATQDHATPDPNAATRITIETGGTPRATLMRYSPDADGEQRGRPRKTSVGSSRSDKTVDQYKARVKTLHIAAIQRRSYDEQNPALVTPMDLVDDLIESAQGENPTRSISTFQQYRAAMLWYLASNRETNSAVAEAYEKLARTLKPPRAAKRPPRRDSVKKSISLEHLQQLLNTIAAMRSWDNAPIHAPSFSQLWILAILATNVRVNEWLFTSWTDETKTRLQVYNSKRKLSHPAFSLMRKHAQEETGQTDDVLSVHDLPEAAIEPGSALDESTEWRFLDVDREHVTFVDQFLRALRAGLDRHAQEGCADEEEAFMKIYTHCRKTIRVAVRRAFGPEQHYSLYTMRSQWAANAKAMMSLSAASIAMGHVGTRTTRGSYAPRKKAHASPIFDGLSNGQTNAQAPADAQVVEAQANPAGPASDTGGLN